MSYVLIVQRKHPDAPCLNCPFDFTFPRNNIQLIRVQVIETGNLYYLINTFSSFNDVLE